MPRYLTVLSILVWPSKQLNGPQIAGAPVDQSSLRASKRVCAEKPRIQSGAANPLRNETRILARCHAAFGSHDDLVNKNSPGLLLATFK